MKHNIIIILIGLVVLSCGYTPNTRIKIRTDCLGCYDEEHFDKAIKYANENNSIMFGVIARSDSSVQLFEGQTGTIIQAKKNKLQIELTSGKRVWVLERHVKRIK